MLLSGVVAGRVGLLELMMDRPVRRRVEAEAVIAAGVGVVGRVIPGHRAGLPVAFVAGILVVPCPLEAEPDEVLVKRDIERCCRVSERQELAYAFNDILHLSLL